MPTKLQVTFAAEIPKGDVIKICLIAKDSQIIPILNQTVAAHLIDAMAAFKFTGAFGKTMIVYHNNVSYLLIGIGIKLDNGTAAENIGGVLFSALAETGAKRGWLADHKIDDTVLVDICFGAKLGSYHFDKYFTDNKSEETAIATIPAATPVQPVPANPPFLHKAMIGSASNILLRDLGIANVIRQEGAIKIWQYRFSECVVDFFFYPASQGSSQLVIKDWDMRSAVIGGRVNEGKCLAAMDRHHQKLIAES